MSADDGPPAKRPKLSEDGDGTEVHEFPASTAASAPENVNPLAEGWRRETECGLLAFLTPTQASFSCTFKQRYSDFIVNEIDEKGKVLKLTTCRAELLEVPAGAGASEVPTPVPVPEEEKSAKVMVEELLARESGDVSLSKQLLEFAEKVLAITSLDDESEETKQKKAALLKEEVLISVGERSKEWRGDFHKLVRKIWPVLRSETKNGGQMRVWFGTDKYDKFADKAKNPGRYLQFLLWKENKDTTDANFLLAKFLGVKSGSVRFAGTKDKRGITTQAIAIPFMDVKRVATLNKKLIGMKIGNFSAINENLGLGALKGNQFRVVLRNIKLQPFVHPSHEGTSNAMNTTGNAMDITADHESLGLTIGSLISTCQAFARTGFINYYGLQRFGTGAVRTHVIGLECLKGNWAEVVDLILKPRPGERPEAEKARQVWHETKDPKKTLAVLPRFMLNERLLLQGLDQFGTRNFLNAFQRLSRPMRLMYPHAYQSYIWNMAASERIKRYGYEVVIGDLVMSDPAALVENMEDESLLETDASVQGEEEKTRDAPTAVKLIESEEEAKKYSMSQVVLPLPGSRVRLPSHDIGKYIEELLAKDGLEITFKNEKEFHLAGDYRPLVVKPLDFTYDVLQHNSLDGELVQTEEEELLQELGQKPKTLDVVAEGGKYVALHLRFSLPSSAYASCLVRELTKQPLDQAFLRDQSTASTVAASSSK